MLYSFMPFLINTHSGPGDAHTQVYLEFQDNLPAIVIDKHLIVDMASRSLT